MFLFVILFGLSMDYHVFILSRVREAYDRGLSNDEAVAHGIKSTAGVVTSAAVVMVGTFSVFALLPLIDMKEMGIGLAAAILIDATLIRAVLLPATMKLLGDRNWYLPSWLEWLPRLEHERGAPEAAPVRTPRRHDHLKPKPRPLTEGAGLHSFLEPEAGLEPTAYAYKAVALPAELLRHGRRTWYSALVQDLARLLVREDLALDALEGVVDRLAVAARARRPSPRTRAPRGSSGARRPRAARGRCRA